MKKVKKLNEDVIRKLIIETIDEVALNEGRKKKMEEAEPVHQPEDTGLDVAHGMEAEPQPQDFGLGLQFSDDEKKNAHDTLDKAFEMAAGTNPMLKDQYKALLKSIEQMFNDRSSTK